MLKEMAVRQNWISRSNNRIIARHESLAMDAVILAANKEKGRDPVVPLHVAS